MPALANQSRIARKSYKESLGTLSGSFACPCAVIPRMGFLSRAIVSLSRTSEHRALHRTRADFQGDTRRRGTLQKNGRDYRCKM